MPSHLSFLDVRAGPIPFALHTEGDSAYTMEVDGAAVLHIKAGGKSARLGAAGLSRYSWREVLRWAAPLPLASLGHVAVHGSAVRRGGNAAAFLGKGEAGKSTLARQLGERGWELVADDMILCDAACRANAAAESMLRDWCESYAGRVSAATEFDFTQLAQLLADPLNQRWTPLRRLWFVDETRSSDGRFRWTELPAVDGFCRLWRYGFGCPPCPGAWVNQFRVFGSLAEQAPSALLQLPAGVEIMRSALPQLEGELAMAGRPE